MIEFASTLSPAVQDAIAALEREVVAADGGRLKLEWSVLRSRSGERPDDLLWWEDDRLAGFLGIYAFGGQPTELSGMVAPGARRHGVGAALLEAALELLRTRGAERTLLIVPGHSDGGRALARAHGGTLDHSEHALLLTGEANAPAASGAGQASAAVPVAQITLRRYTEADVPELSRILEAGFGMPPQPGQLADGGARSGRETLVIERNGATVGTAALDYDGVSRRGAVYGFAVAPELRGRGIGRAALEAMCARLREQGAERIALEVAVENAAALGLYTSLGFAPISTEEYYAIALSR